MASWLFPRFGIRLGTGIVSEIIYSTLGAIPWSILLVFAGVQLGSRWVDIRHTLQPYDTLILMLVVLLVVGFIWWRLGMPGWSRIRSSTRGPAE